MPINVNAAPIRIILNGAQGTPAILYPLSVANQAARLALTAAQARNRLVVEADTGISYMLTQGGDPTDNGDWIAIATYVLNNFDAVAAPTVNDDSGDGYSQGSKWYDTIGQEAYICVDSTVGAAVWIQTTLDAEDLGDAAFRDSSEGGNGAADSGKVARFNAAGVLLPDGVSAGNLGLATTGGNVQTINGDLVISDGINTGRFRKPTLTGNRIWTGQDKDGTIAYTNDAAMTDERVPTSAGLASKITGATSKSTPVDADELPLADSAASYGLKKLTWSNLKATAKTYFDGLYVALTGNQTVAGVKTFSDNAIFSGDLTVDGTTFKVNSTTNQTLVTAGSKTVPTIAWEADTDTGIFFGGDGSLWYTANGSAVWGAAAANVLGLSNGVRLGFSVGDISTAAADAYIGRAGANSLRIYDGASTDGTLQVGTLTVGSGTWNGSTISGAQAFSSTTRPTSSGTGTPASTSLITLGDGLRPKFMLNSYANSKVWESVTHHNFTTPTYGAPWTNRADASYAGLWVTGSIGGDGTNFASSTMGQLTFSGTGLADTSTRGVFSGVDAVPDFTSSAASDWCVLMQFSVTTLASNGVFYAGLGIFSRTGAGTGTISYEVALKFKAGGQSDFMVNGSASSTDVFAWSSGTKYVVECRKGSTTSKTYLRIRPLSSDTWTTIGTDVSFPVNGWGLIAMYRSNGGSGDGTFAIQNALHAVDF